MADPKEVEGLTDSRLVFAPADSELCELGAWGLLVDVEEHSVFLLVEWENLAKRLERLITALTDERERIIDALLRTINANDDLRRTLLDRAGDNSLEELLEKSSIGILVV